MAAFRSSLRLFQSLRVGHRKLPFESRFISSDDAMSIPDLSEDETTDGSRHNNDLRSRIFALRLPKRSALNVIQRWVKEGNVVSAFELRLISKELRRVRRYKHALEIFEWMVSSETFQLSDSDIANRIDLMAKVFGLEAAERYFENLSPASKSCEAYAALLHSYAAVKETERAERLYQRIKESNLPFTALVYNEIMTLYISVGQIEKVPLVIEDLKCLNISRDIFTYNLWISSCAATLKIDTVRSILEEMRHDSGFNDDWLRYINTVKVYVTASLLSNSGTGSIVETEKGMTQREWITYDFVVMLHVGLGNRDKIDEIWESLKLTKKMMTSRNYICIISSYLMLENLKKVEEIVDQWRESAITVFDPSACARIVDALSGSGFTETAYGFRALLIERNCNLS